MWYLLFLESASAINKLTILEHKNGQNTILQYSCTSPGWGGALYSKNGVLTFMVIHRVLKCDVIQFFFFFFAFQHFHGHISVEHDEKLSHTKFDTNWFMVARDMAAWIPN